MYDSSVWLFVRLPLCMWTRPSYSLLTPFSLPSLSSLLALDTPPSFSNSFVDSFFRFVVLSVKMAHALDDVPGEGAKERVANRGHHEHQEPIPPRDRLSGAAPYGPFTGPRPTHRPRCAGVGAAPDGGPCGSNGRRGGAFGGTLVVFFVVIFVAFVAFFALFVGYDRRRGAPPWVSCARRRRRR